MATRLWMSYHGNGDSPEALTKRAQQLAKAAIVHEKFGKLASLKPETQPLSPGSATLGLTGHKYSYQCPKYTHIAIVSLNNYLYFNYNFHVVESLCSNLSALWTCSGTSRLREGPPTPFHVRSSSLWDLPTTSSASTFQPITKALVACLPNEKDMEDHQIP